MPAGERVFRRLDDEYRSIRAVHLPVVDSATPVWASSRDTTDQQEGWKLHISATLHSAADVLQAVSSVIAANRIPYKGVRGLTELKRLNVGFQPSQIGKAFTIYVPEERDPRELAQMLAPLVHGMPGPEIPFEERAFKGSNVFYRYGSYSSLYIRGPRGGKRKDDRRVVCPPWIVSPFPRPEVRSPRSLKRLNTFDVLACLSQRGKGGVYRVQLDDRTAILKEGRRYGETSPLGDDGHRLLTREYRLLTEHSIFAEVGAPSVLEYFKSRDTAYLVEEDAGLKPLAAWRTLQDRETIAFAGQLIQIVRQLHQAGWAWRDVKPMNVIVGPESVLRPIDFESAVRAKPSHAAEPIGSPGFVPPDWLNRGRNPLRQDIYALGVSLLWLLDPTIDRFLYKANSHSYVCRAIQRLRPAGNFRSEPMLLDALARLITENPIDADRDLDAIEAALYANVEKV